MVDAAVIVRFFFPLYYNQDKSSPKKGGLTPLQLETRFWGKLLGFSIGRGSGALKGLRAVEINMSRLTKDMRCPLQTLVLQQKCGLERLVRLCRGGLALHSGYTSKYTRCDR